MRARARELEFYMEDQNWSSFVGECVGWGRGGPAPCSSLDSCRHSGIVICLFNTWMCSPPAELPWWLTGLECWSCKPEIAGSLLGPFSLHLLCMLKVM